mmetsp:Transcript_135/g.175  ORF Transcript_135/g.175 Transcript_135/m.175 type:complete len:143 (+) Transcript_135:406-834(+)
MFQFSAKAETSAQDANLQITLMHKKLQDAETLVQEYEDEVAQLNQENRAVMKALEGKDIELNACKERIAAYEEMIKSFCNSEGLLKSLLRDMNTAKSVLPGQPKKNVQKFPKKNAAAITAERNEVENKYSEHDTSVMRKMGY